VQLTAQPTANVVVTFTNTGGQVTQTGSLTFTPANWNLPQTLAISAVDDPFVEGPHTDSITFVTSSTDTEFDSLTARR